MEPRNRTDRKSSRNKFPGDNPANDSHRKSDLGPRSDSTPPKLLTVRSALVFTLALLVAAIAAGLLYVARRNVALAVLGGLGAFATALKLLDSMIE